MAELERRREAIRQREEAERLEAEKKRAAEEAERKRLAEEAERKRQEELERQRQLEEQERQRKAAEAEKQRQAAIEQKRAEMVLEKKRLQVGCPKFAQNFKNFRNNLTQRDIDVTNCNKNMTRHSRDIETLKNEPMKSQCAFNLPVINKVEI